MTKILVTGSSGFIGGHIVDHYVSLGHEVTGVDSRAIDPDCSNSKARYITANLTTISNELLLNLVSGFDIVNHHAASVDVRKSISDPSFDVENNVLTSVRLAEACVKMKVRRLVQASSGGAIADSEYPESPYGISKLATEKYLSFFSKHYGLDVIVLRYSNIYGPRQQGGVIPIFIERMLKNQPITVNGGSQERDFVYVKDVVAANEIALTREIEPYFFPNNIYTICSGSNISISDLANHLKSLCNSSSTIISNPLIPGEVLTSSLVPTSLLDWELTSLEAGLKLTINSFK